MNMSGLDSLTTLSASPVMSESEDIQECSETIVQIVRQASAELLRAADQANAVNTPKSTRSLGAASSFNPVIETSEYESESEPSPPSSRSEWLKPLIDRSKTVLSNSPGLEGSPRGSSSWEYPMAVEEKRHRLILVYEQEAALADMHAIQMEENTEHLCEVVARLRAENRRMRAKARLYKAQLEQGSRVQQQIHQLLVANTRPLSLKTKQLQRRVRRRVQRLRAERLLESPKVHPKRCKPLNQLPREVLLASKEFAWLKDELVSEFHQHARALQQLLQHSEPGSPSPHAHRLFSPEAQP